MSQPACAQGIRPLLSPSMSMQDYSKGRVGEGEEEAGVGGRVARWVLM